MTACSYPNWIEKAGADDFVREMLGFVAQRMMELDVEGRCGAGHGERPRHAPIHATGFRDRDWHTRAGTVALRIPKLRSGSYFPLSGASHPSEKALAAVIQKPTQGISTRLVDDPVKAMGMTNFQSKSHDCVPRSTSACTASLTDRSRATGLTCGLTPPT